MTQDMAGAALDFIYVMLLWLPGILAAWIIGERNRWRSLTLGFAIGATVVIILFHLMALFQATSLWWLVSKLVLCVFALIGLGVILRRKDFSVLTPIGLAGVITFFAVFLRNILRLDGRLRGPDQFLVGWMSSLAQSGHDPSFFGPADYVKRGFAMPLLLAQGREGQLLLSVTVVVLALALISSFSLTSAIGTRWNLLGFSFGITLVVFWLTTPLVGGMAFFLNGHALMALGLAILATQTSIRRPLHPNQSIVANCTVFIAGFIVASTRPEGVALALIISLPLFRPSSQWGRGGKWLRLLGILGAPFGFIFWLMTANIVKLGLGASLIVSILILGGTFGLFLIVQWRPRLWEVCFTAIGAILIAATLVQLIGLPPRWATIETFVSNTFLGTGLWGYLPWIFLLTLLAHLLLRAGGPSTVLAILTVFAVLFTIGVKIIDGVLIIGGVPGLSVGWFDSINRSLFHLLPLFSALFMNLPTLGHHSRGRFITRGRSTTGAKVESK